MMMTKDWSDTSWSDRDSAEAMVGGESKTLEITAVGRTRHGPKNVYYFSLSFSLDLDFSSTRRQRRRKRIFKVHHRERTSLTCISIVGICCSTAVGTQYCCFLIKIIVNAGHEYFTTVRVYIMYLRAQVSGS